MKTLIALLFLSFATASLADEMCTYAIQDTYGFEFEAHTRTSYSRQAACSDAEFTCRQAIAYGQSQGRYYNVNCVYKGGGMDPNRPPFPPTSVMCTTDLVDYYGRIVRSFSGNGRNDYEACNQSDTFCNYELSRNNTSGYRCITRGTGNGPRPPQPPRQTTEQCKTSRFDPAGYYIESYIQSYTGPIGTDVKGEACRRALNVCSQEIRGRQTCRVDY